MNKTASARALQDAIALIPHDYFDSYPGGWPGRISLALTDAVYSIGARYETKNGKGVLPALLRLQQEWEKLPENPRNSLKLLERFSETALRDIMGRGKVAPGKPGEQYKSSAVLAAAQQFRKLGIDSSEDLLSIWSESRKNQQAIRKAYTSVPGLGKVTFEYFHMLLGIPGIKADRMITRFVAKALHDSAISPEQAHAVLFDAYQDWAVENTGTLTSFEHAIWLFERERKSIKPPPFQY